MLRYYFFDKETDGQKIVFDNGTEEWRTWTTNEQEKDIVRKAFAKWKSVGIGLEFKEAGVRDEAEMRIGFMKEDGSWSYIGREILKYGRDERTMNFGWDLTRDPREIDTAVHEIGHTLGFPHEHQNPNAGIVWDEEAVYRTLAQKPNYWNRETTYYNIIKKIEPDTIQGSNWDPNSIMHYPFEPGLIKEPKQYYNNGLFPEGGLSLRDKMWVQKFYPALKKQDYTELKPFQSTDLAVEAGQQKDFIFEPPATKAYDMRTFGKSDSVMVLFEEVNGELRYVTASDDSGEDRNAAIQVKLFKGRKYILRVRVYYLERSGEVAVMVW